MAPHSTKQAGDDSHDHRRDGGHILCTYPYLLYVNEMAAALGELEMRASLIAHVLPSAASMFRKDGALKFLAGSTSTSGKQQFFIHWLGIATCGNRRRGRACWVSLATAFPVANGFQQNGVHRQETSEPSVLRCKTCIQRCKLQIGFGGSMHATRRAPAADRLREPESAHDGLSIPATWSKVRGRYLAPVMGGDVALPRVV